MAEIIVTTTPVNLNVTTTQSNITVTDVETNVTVNVASLSSNITVTSEPVNVTIAPSIGVSNSEVRAALGNTNPILYDVNSGVFSFDADAAFNNAKVIGAIQSGNVTLKQVQETYFDLGNTSSTTLNIDIVNGTIQGTLLQSNINQISFANLSPGGGVTVFLEQDAFGFRLLDTSTNFNNWLFVDDFKTLSVGSGNVDSLSVIYDGTTYYASLTRLNSADIDATFDNITVRYNTISNVLTSNTVTVTNGLTSTATSNFVGAVTLGNNLNVAGQLYADGNQIYIGQPGTGTNKIITGYSSTTAGQIFYNGSDSTWYFRNNTAGGGTFKIPTSTTDLAQGTNLYFTTDQANSAIQNYKGTISTTGSITTTANVQGNYFIGNGSLLSGITSTSNAQLVSYIATVPLTVGGNLTVNGNINATGNINVQNVEDLYVRDQTIVLNANAASPANVQIVSNRPGLANTEIKWNEQTDRWTFTNDGTTYFPIPTSTTDLVEGANLYYTTARANSAIGAYQGNINTAGTLTVGTAEINGNLVLDPAFGNANIVGQSTQDDLTIAFENIDLRIGSAFDEGRLFVRDNVSSNVLMSISAQEADNYTTRLRGDVIIGVDPNTGNTFGQFVFDVAQGDLDVAGGLEAETLFGNSAISSINGNIFTTNGNIYTTSGNVSGAYIKGNGSELTGLSTTQIAEGANLWFTTGRANTAIGAYQGSINTSGNIQGNYILGNGAFLTGITSGGTVTNIATGENLTGGPITTTGTIGMANSLANVNSVSSETSANLTLVTNKLVNVNTRQRNGTLTSSANIHGEGFALFQGFNFFNAPFMSYSGTSELKSFGFDASITTGSNVITVTAIYDLQGNPVNVSNVTQYYVFTEYPLSAEAIAFPPGTYVTGTSGSSIYMSANATITDTFFYDSGNPYNSYGGLSPGMLDNTTGLLIALESDFDDGGADAQLITYNFLTNNDLKYGYSASGPITTDFTYAIGTASDYTIDTNVSNQFLVGRTNFSATKTVGNFRRGLTIGDADLTNRGENDGIQSFGLNMVWDGTEDTVANYGSDAVFPQMLFKQYTDGTNQAFGVPGLTNSGPRMLFIGAYGKNTDPAYSTYAREAQEIGRITWISSTDNTLSPGTLAPPAFISVISNRDQTGTGPNDFGMYLVASPSASNNQRAMWAGHHKANTIISAGSRSSGTSGNIIFAPARQTTNSNTLLHSENIVNSSAGSPHWAKIGYDNPASNTGAKVSVTNGFNTTSARNGNISLVLDRNDNGAGFGSKEWALKLQSGSNDLVLTEDDVVRTTFSGANITTSGNISAGNTIVNGVSFNTAGTTSPSSGEIVFNSNYGTHQVGLTGSNVMLMGQDLVVYARNDEANTLSKGEVVYISGASGDKATVRRATNNSDNNSATTIGIVKSDIAAGALGYVVSQGVVDGINLGAYTAGDKLYLGNVAGTFTNVKPSSPAHYVFIGVVERANAGNGQILVRVQNGFELDEIHDIKLTNVQQNDMLIRNAGNSLWVNQSVGSVVANTSITLKQYQETRVDLGSTGGSLTLNMANGSIFAMTATSSISNIALSNAGVGASGTLIITQDGTGGKTLTTTSAWKFANGAKTLSTAAGAIDIISFFTDGTTVYAALSKGYS